MKQTKTGCLSGKKRQAKRTMEKRSSFSHLENTKVYQNYHNGWTAETKVKVNGKNWVITTLKRSGGKISTHCQKVEDQGNGNYSYMLFSSDKTESFWLNELPKGTKATEKVIREAHFKSLALFDEKQEAGELPNEKEEYKIEVGQVLFTDGPWDENRRVIYEIEPGSFGIKYKTVHLDGSRTEIDDYISPFSKKFGIGVYYKENDKIDVSLIPDLLISAYENMEQEKAAEAVQTQINQEQQKAKAEYLSQFIRADRRTSTNILKRHILKTFPTVQKVEVKTDSFSGGSSMDVNYYAPKEIKELEALIDRFQYGSFNGMEDIYESNPDHTEIIIDGHILVDYKYTGCKFYKVEAVEVQPEPKAETIKEKPATNANFELVDYSEKALALFGDTKPIKEQLKEIGGRFNPYLNYNGQKRAGWIFSKSKAEQLKNIINK